jgi:S1-C subfamily serine protease
VRKAMRVTGACAFTWYFCLLTRAAVADVDWSQIAADNKSAIVDIEVTYRKADSSEGTTQATGFVIDDAGHVLTNKHLLQLDPDAQLRSITASVGSREGSRYQMRVKGFEATLDLALLEFVNIPPGAHAVRRASSASLAIGEPVATMGFPKITETTDYRPATGNLTDVAADIGNLTAGLEAEMTLYPGNSGGPLFNAKGDVIGIVVARLNKTVGGDPTNRVAYFLRIEQANNLIGLTAEPLAVARPKSGPPAAPVETVRYPSLHELSLADVPTSAFASFPRPGSLASLRAQIAKYPALELSQNTLKLEGGSGLRREPVTLFFSRLRLDDSSILLLNANAIFVVGELDLSRGRIKAFPDGIGSAATGRNGRNPSEPGGNGANGADAGSLTIYVVTEKRGELEIDLSGQKGGDGGEGGPGSAGAPGKAGQGGADHLFDCARGPGDGERGGRGGDGAVGGGGGDGGRGGNMTLIAVGEDTLQRKSISFKADGGPGGAGGRGGVGGPGGPGGPRGAQTTYCHGGSNGPTGEVGNPGPTGPSGRKGGDGRLDFQIMTFEQFPDF